MSDERARETILNTIKRRLEGQSARLERAELDRQMASRTRHLVPARSALDPAGQLALFIEMAQRAAASVERVATLDAVPSAVAEFVTRQNLPSEITLAGRLADLPWHEQSRLRPVVRAARDGDIVTVTAAIAGVAETGTLVLASGADSPSTLSFLPDCNIVVLARSAIVGAYEDALDPLRDRALPRTVNFITGPSRSADIEQTLQLGAHGPVQVHILIVDGA